MDASTNDDVLERVTANVTALLEAQGITKNRLQTKVQEIAGNKTSAPTDLLKKGRTDSTTIKSLALIARALGVPVYSLFLEPDKRAALRTLLDTVGTSGPDEILETAAMIQTFREKLASREPKQ